MASNAIEDNNDQLTNTDANKGIVLSVLLVLTEVDRFGSAFTNRTTHFSVEVFKILALVVNLALVVHLALVVILTLVEALPYQLSIS